jgi:hypothetical protein
MDAVFLPAGEIEHAVRRLGATITRTTAAVISFS